MLWGESLPYRFCIQIGNKSNSASPGLLSKYVTLKDFKIIPAVDGAEVVLLKANHAIIALTGFETLKKKTGGAFYNTQVGHLIENTETPVITFDLNIDVSEYNRLFESFGNEFAFDYFLQNPENNREIHFIDYPPTELYKDYNKDLGDRNQTTYYCSEKRFVWALKAPVEMGWNVETKDVKFVYPEFATWVERGGNWLEDGSLTNSNRPWCNVHNTDGWADPAKH